MQEAGLPVLASWQNFYIIMGSGAATLTGLLFVVITITSGIEAQVTTLNEGISAFTTPTVFHFCAVLLISGIFNAPWKAYWQAGLFLGLTSLGGIVYFIIIIRRLVNMSSYRTPIKDWLWYVIYPLAMYVVIIAAAAMLTVTPELALYFVSAAVLVLLFISIHNAWDLVTYLAIDRAHTDNQ